jgi:hypothetical protein
VLHFFNSIWKIAGAIFAIDIILAGLNISDLPKHLYCSLIIATLVTEKCKYLLEPR